MIVPKANLVGELNDGWRITMGALAHERGALWVEGVMGAQRGIDDLVRWPRPRAWTDDPVVRRRIAELAARVAGAAGHGLQGVRLVRPGQLGPRAQLHEDGHLRGAPGASTSWPSTSRAPNRAVTDPAVAAEGARWQRSWMTSLASTIGGGTSEIQRNVIATRVLGPAPGLTRNDPMDFSLSDEQELLVDTARALFAKECPPGLVRAVGDRARPGRQPCSTATCATGWPWSAPPPDGSMVDLSLFLIEAGAAVAPGPFLATAGLFVPLLRAAGHDLAEAASAGEVTGTVAVAGPDGRSAARRARSAAEPHADPGASTPTWWTRWPW